MPENIIITKLIEEAKRWAKAKVPYRHMGTSMSGCDCTGLLIGVMKKLGYLKNFKLPFYPPDWNLHDGNINYLLQYLPKYANKVNNSELIPGDVLLFKFGRQLSHVGIYIGEDLFVHTYLTRHTWYGRLKDSLWDRHWKSTWRLAIDRLE